MLVSLFQATGGIDFSMIPEIGPGLDPFSGIAGLGIAVAALSIVLMILAVAIAIINLFNIYHWGMTDKAVLEGVGENKAKWFKIIFIVPLISGIINVIPLLGQVLSLILSVYWAVMVLIYFFSVRKKAPLPKPVPKPEVKTK